MNEKDVTQAKILGVLIRDARQYAGRSPDDCARILHLAPEQIAAAEEGRYLLSLPELEALALYLRVPLAHFWGQQTLGTDQATDFTQLVAIRQRLVGALLRQAREQAGRTAAEAAQSIGIERGQLEAYETGQAAVPLPHLERLGDYLGVGLDYFLDGRRGPLARHEAELALERGFKSLAPDLQQFVTEPRNTPYLATAMRLSALDGQQLRQLAESLLEITY
ncbi:MAG: helix-turn-helix transcriptional regulator [Chloroflexota bacterium]